MPANRSRAWCFTLNNWTQEEYDKLLAADYQYIVVGKETGDSGTPHLQGYLYLAQRTRLNSLKKKYNERAHWEVAKGSPEKNFDYCTKDGDWEQRGELPDTEGGDTEKERWKNALKAAKDGRLDDIPADIYFRYYNTCKRIRDDHIPRPDDASDVTGLWVYGPAGCGKSRWVREQYPAEEIYHKALNKWWDGYKGEPIVLVDDIDPKSGVSRHNLKHWCDRYAFPAEYKGGQMMIRPKKVIFTSQYSITQCFPGDQETIDAITRRCQVKVMGLQPPTIHWSPIIAPPA